MSVRPSIPRAEDFRFHCDIEVRFRDLDAMGHVNNAVYATYFEVARLAYVKALGFAEPEVDVVDMQPFIMLDIHCRFLAQAKFGETLVVHLRTVSIGTKSFTFEYLISRRTDGAAMATGLTTQVCFSYARQETQAVPQDFRQRIERLEGRAIPARASSA